MTSLGSTELARVLSSTWYHLDEAERLLQTPGALLGSMARGMLGAALPVMGVLVVSALAAHISQVGLLWAPRALEPKLSKLDPVRGLRQKLLSKDAAANLVKTLLKLVFVVAVAAGALWALEFDPGQMVRMPPEDFAALWSNVPLPLLACALAMVGVGVLDFAWQRHRTRSA